MTTILRIFGFLLVAVFLLLLGSPQKSGDFHGNLHSPIVALELAWQAPQVEAVRDFLGASAWQSHLQQSLQADAVGIIPVYGLILLGFSFLLVLQNFRGAKWLGLLTALFTLLAVIFDYWENDALRRVMLGAWEQITDASLRQVWRPSVVKWASLFLAFGGVATLFLARARQAFQAKSSAEAGEVESLHGTEDERRFFRTLLIVTGLLWLASSLSGLVGIVLFVFSQSSYALLEQALLPGVLAILSAGVLLATRPQAFVPASPKPTIDALPLPLFKVLLDEYAEQQRQAQWGIAKLAKIELSEALQKEHADCAAAFVATEDAARQAALSDRMQQLDDKLVREFYAKVHQHAKDPAQRRAALCFSGGGVRSATFALGLLQGLMKQGIQLGNFHYLSTVSGGGYTGCWLSAWAQRETLEKVQTESQRPQDSFHPEAAPLQHLRRYSNPLAPNLGLLSADMWTLVGIYLRNLTLNWLVLLPLLMVFLALPRLAMAFAVWDHPAPWLLKLLPLAGLLLSSFALAYIVANRPSLQRLQRINEWRRDEVGFLLYGLLPLFLAAALFSSFGAWVPIRYGTGAEVSLRTECWLGALLALGGLALGRLAWRGDHLGRTWKEAPLPFVLALLTILLGAGGLIDWFVGKPATSGLKFGLAQPLIYILLAWAMYAGGMFISWFLSGRWDRREVFLSLPLTGLIGGLFLWGAAQLYPKPVEIGTLRKPFAVTSTATPQPDKQFVKLSGEPLTLTLETDPQKKQTALKLATPITTAQQAGAPTASEKLRPRLEAIQHTAWFVVWGAPLFLLAFLAAATIFIGMSSGITTDSDREWLARAGALMLMVGLAWIIVSVTVLFGPDWMWRANTYLMAALTTGSGLTTLILGWLPKTSASTEGNTQSKSMSSRLLGFALPLAAIIFALSLFALLSLATDVVLRGLAESWPVRAFYAHWLPGRPAPLSQLAKGIVPANLAEWHWILLHEVSGPIVLLGTLVLLLMGGVLGFFVNVNKFSLHAANRDRLMRAYLGASNAWRRPNPFTGFDARDDVQMHELLEPLFTADSFKDFDGFAAWLKENQKPEAADKLAEFLWKECAPATRQRLLDYQPRPADVAGEAAGLADKGSEEERTLRRLYALELNRIIQGELLVPVQPQTQIRLNKVFYLPQRAEGIFDASAIQNELNQQPIVPIFPAKWLPGKFLLSRQIPVERLRLNRRLVEKACAAYLVPCSEALTEARPFHVVNMALNLVNGDELAWQERKARSFFASPLHVGAPGVGLRSVKNYGIEFGGKGALTLGTALAISGAAANPNAGYHSSPLITFFLTFFNVRLGWWLGNPGQAGQYTHRVSSPFFAPNALLAETFGFTDDEHPYVNLSDGGHFDNLGLYEMVRRRCHFIVVSDGGQDDKYSYDDIGIAIRMIRADMGIPIRFRSPLPSGTHTAGTDRRADKNQNYCALAEIDYQSVDGQTAENGWLVLVKPAIYGKEPADIYNHSLSNPAFPNDPTFTDQFFSEAQFESYRHLGEFIIGEVVNHQSGLDSNGFLSEVRGYLKLPVI